MIGLHFFSQQPGIYEVKLQRLWHGLYLAWEKNPDVQILIAFPDRFGDWLPKGIKGIKRYKI